jgi:hypothetical protein
MCGRVVFGGLFVDLLGIVCVSPNENHFTAENAEIAENAIVQVLCDLGVLGG